MILLLILLLILLFPVKEHFAKGKNYFPRKEDDWRIMRMPTKTYPRHHLIHPTEFQKTILHNIYWSPEYKDYRTRHVQEWDMNNPAMKQGYLNDCIPY